MSSKLKQAWPCLRLVSSVKTPKLRKTILSHLAKDNDFCSACREISKNIVKRKIVIKGVKARRLKRFKKLITALSKKKNSKGVKLKLVRQSGGWLAAVIPLVATVIGELLRK